MSARNLFGIIGRPLGHSFSRGYHNSRFKELVLDAEYQNFELADITEFKSFCESHVNLVGLNVTVPYKEAVMPYLTKLDTSATRVGAVNTILFQDARSTGYNTDLNGFGNSLDNWLDTDVSHALILGTGGSSKAVATALEDRGVAYRKVSRNPASGDLAYPDLDSALLSKYRLIINTTPVGMFPEIARCPDIPYHLLTNRHRVFDIIYNPEKTLLLERAEKQGARVVNGLEMLHLQADFAWEIWKTHLR